MRFEKMYDSDVKSTYTCDRCNENVEVWAGKNTVYSNKKCPKCDNGYLQLEQSITENKSAAISYSYTKEKQVQWLRDRTERQRRIGKKLGF